jgi:hypothetical protein
VDVIVATLLAEIRPGGVLTGIILASVAEKWLIPWLVNHYVPVLRRRYTQRHGR